MRRTINKIQIDESIHGGRYRWTVDLYDEPACEEGSDLANMRRYQFLQALSEQAVPLLMCGPVGFETMRVYHNGVCWVASLVGHENTLTPPKSYAIV